MAIYEGPLGRKPPTDDRHLIRYSLTDSTIPRVPTPVVLGINWYSRFDAPTPDRQERYWLVPGGVSDFGRLRGGHAVCLLPPGMRDYTQWQEFYNQGREGACVGFAISRMMTLLNRQRYDARRLYHEALKIDEWPGEADEGTSVRAGLDVARETGMWRFGRWEDDQPDYAEGITANRWARDITDICECLSPGDNGARILHQHGYVTMLNSWGKNYPHLTRIPLDVLNRLVFGEHGDAAVVTDR